MGKRQFTVGDILLWRDREFGVNRAWEVDAILLGAEGHESLVRLRSMFMKPGHDESGDVQATVLVPECLLRGLESFAKLQAAA